MPANLNKRTIGAGTVGTILEWYDLGVYAFLAAVLAKHFFPAGDQSVSLIAAFGVFAGGYLMRPIGAVVIAHSVSRVASACHRAMTRSGAQSAGREPQGWVVPHPNIRTISNVVDCSPMATMPRKT